MKPAFLVLGLILLVAGLGLLFWGFANPIVTQTSQVSTQQVDIPQVNNQVVAKGGTFATPGVELQQGTTVEGTFTNSNFTSSSGRFYFYVQDTPTYNSWGSCKPCAVHSSYNQSATASGVTNLYWAAPSSGTYYFIFDGEAYKATSVISLSATAKVQSTTTQTNTSANAQYVDVGSGLAIVGGALAVVGVVLGRGKRRPSPAQS